MRLPSHSSARAVALRSLLATAVVALTVPAASLEAAPSGSIDAIRHVVVLMQENRSFDDYLGQLPHEGQPNATGEPANASNPDPLDPSGPPIAAFHQPDYCEVADLNHSWNGAHREWDNGAMDGFTAANVDPADPTGSRSMGYYDAADLPYYYALDNTFAIGDHYFSSVLTGTYPNRLYLYAATSFGHIANDLPGPTGFAQPTIFNRLDAAHVSWKIYYSQFPFAALFSYVQAHSAGHLFPIASYYADAAAGTLPQVAFIDPVYAGPNTVENDEHPPSDVQVGEQFVSGVVGALTSSPNWSSSALFLTYDEWGGYYDNVAPPAAPKPDAIPPMLTPGDVPGAFDRYGIRVPITVISPYARPHFVSHVVNDHTSILRFIERRFDLPALTRRDAKANPMLEFFDFKHPAFATPPVLPAAPLDPTQLAVCATRPSNNLP